MKSKFLSAALLHTFFYTVVIITCIVFPLSVNSFAQEMPGVNSKKWTGKYDQYFKKYSKRFFGVGFDWKWFKAQAIAESSLRDNVKSWAGAKGIMQIVPRTFEEIQKKNPSFTNISDPRWNIAAGIYYDRQQFMRWKDITNDQERLRFMFASYNAGRRTILNAQKVSINEGFSGIAWQEIEAIADKVPRWRSTETIGYIFKIHVLMDVKK